MTEKAIKSVQRVFEILEMFDQERRPLAAREVSKRLGYPLMSAHELLKSMRHLGYADFDETSRTYLPARMMLSVLEWTRDYLDSESNIFSLIEALNMETSETINLSRRVGAQVKIIHGLETRQAFGVSVKIGTMMAITGSLTGMTSLSGFNEEELDKFLSNLKSIDTLQAQRVDTGMIENVVAEIREYGAVARANVTVDGIGAVCTPILSGASDDVFVIGIVGPSDRIIAHQDEHRKTLKRLTKQYNVKTLYKLRNPKN